MNDTCATCNYSRARDVETVLCCYLPPVLVPAKNANAPENWQFPICKKSDWCSRHKDGLI